MNFKCSSQDCSYIGRETAVKKHIEQCENLAQECTHCNDKIKRKNFKKHEMDCNKRIVVCLFCKESMKKMELEEHIEKCKYISYICKPCKILTMKQILNTTTSLTSSINLEEGK